MYFMRYILFFIAIAFNSSASAQNIQKKLEAAAANPSTTQNAAKADVYIVQKQLVIWDTAVIPPRKKASHTNKRK